jgi:hypothetical protein
VSSSLYSCNTLFQALAHHASLGTKICGRILCNLCLLWCSRSFFLISHCVLRNALPITRSHRHTYTHTYTYTYSHTHTHTHTQAPNGLARLVVARDGLKASVQHISNIDGTFRGPCFVHYIASHVSIEFHTHTQAHIHT